MPWQDYRSWNWKPKRASAEERAKVCQGRMPHKGFKQQRVLTPKRKKSRYTDSFLLTLVKLRFGSLTDLSIIK